MRISDAFFADVLKVARKHGIAAVGTSILPYGECDCLEVMVFSEIEKDSLGHRDSVWRQQRNLEAIGGQMERWETSTGAPELPAPQDGSGQKTGEVVVALHDRVRIVTMKGCMGEIRSTVHEGSVVGFTEKGFSQGGRYVQVVLDKTGTLIERCALPQHWCMFEGVPEYRE